MNEDLQTTDALRSWLADAEYPRSTGPVVDAVLGSIGSIRQEPASSVRNAPRRYAWVSLAAAAAVVVAIGVSLLRPEPATGPGVVPSASATPTATRPPTRSSSPDPFEGVPEFRMSAQMIDVPGSSHAYLGVTDEAVWAAESSGLVRIDPTKLESEQVERASRFGLAANQDEVWVTDIDAGTLSQFDPATSEGTEVADLSGNPGAVAIFGNSVWVAQEFGGSVTRLEASSGAVVKEIPVGIDGAAGPRGIAADSQGVWVGVPNEGSVVRIDPSTNEIVAEIEVTTSPCGGIALQPDAVWVSSCYNDHYVIHIDPRTNELVAEIDVGGFNGVPVLVDGYPWFPVGNRLVRIDPATDRIDQIVAFWFRSDFGLMPDEFPSFGATVGFDSIWIESSDGRMARIGLDALQSPFP